MSTRKSTLYCQRSERRLCLSGTGVVIWFAALALAFSLTSGLLAAPVVPGQILIKTRNPIPESVLSKRLNSKSLHYRKSLSHLNVHVISVSEEHTESILAQLRNDPEVEFAERDGLASTAFVVNDPYVASGQEWHLGTIQANQAWQVVTGAPGTVVAVLDSGVNASHPDLAGRILTGYDFVWNDSDSADDFGHGTAVAGVIVAGGNNGVGVAGVAYGCSVLPVKVVDTSGFAPYSTIAEGIKYAVDQGARIINISISGSTPSLTLQEAIDYAWSHNVLVVAAAGNSGSAAPQYPAACNHVLAVAATEPDDSLASFSTFGASIALSAPGDTIWTTQRDLANPYAAWRGTSFASPIVAGVAALLASADPSLSNLQLVSLLEGSADDLGPAGWDPSFGHGRVNAARALTMAGFTNAIAPEIPVVPATPPDSVPPSVRLVQAPRNGARLSVPMVTITGMAYDDVSLDRIQVGLNGSALEPLPGRTNWQTTLALVPGTNVVRIQAVDSAGNLSTALVRSFFYVVTSPLTLLTNGLGRVAPNLNGAQLEIGRTYQVRAIPAPGQAFSDWDGAPAQQGARLQFVMQSNLTLVANFVPSPFPAVKGHYAGLIANANSVLPDSSGAFALTVNASGLFTGRLTLGGQRSGFVGLFDLAGEASVTVRRGRLPPVRLELHIDLNGGTDTVTGMLTDGAWVADLSGERNVFHWRLNPPPQTGLRSFLLEQGAANPMAAGTGLGKICAGGAAAVRGRLNDGRVFVSSAIVGKSGDYPLYLSFNRGREVVIGWVNFPAASSPTASGTVVWVNTGTNAFAATLQVASAP